MNEEVNDCTVEWNAKEAFRNKVGTYYVRYENAILVFSEEEAITLTEEHII